MAERTVTVRLRALVDDYKRAMASAGKATNDAVAKADRWKQVGRSTAAVGDSLSRNVTLPLVAVGVAATKMATDFDNVFVRMQSLAGVTSGEVDGLKESVLGLAGETGRAPQELAEALYFLNSSGLDSAAAMEALEASAKASAAGLGQTEVIADAVSSAMNAYAAAGLEAAEATDILVATARAGKAEPEQLAASLGQVLPIASELGVTFADVGGAVASLSLTGNDAARSATLLTNVLSKLLKPSMQGAEALEEVGLSTEHIREMIAEQGLLGTLDELKARLGDAGFVRFLEDAQAVQGALALTGQNADQVADVFDQVADSAGATESAFATWADSMGAENARAWANFQAQMIRLGDVIAPIASQVLGFAGDIGEAFGKLPDGVQTAVVAVGLFAAAIGPLLSVGGRLITTVGTLYQGLLNLAVPAGTVSGAFGKGTTAAGTFASKLTTLAIQAGLTVAALEVAGQIGQRLFPDSSANVSKLENALLDLGNTGEATGELLGLVGDDFGDLADAFDRVVRPGVSDRLQDVNEELLSLGGIIDTGQTNLDEARQTIDDLDKALAQLAARDPEAAAAAFTRITEALEEQGVSSDEARGMLDDYDTALTEMDTAGATSGVEDTTGAFDEQGEVVNEAAQALRDYADALQAQFDPLFGMVDALHANRDAQAEVLVAQAALDTAVRDHGATSAEAAEAQLALRDAQIAAGRSALDLQGAVATLQAGVEDGTVSLDAAQSQLQTWVDQGLISADTAAVMAFAFAGAATQADNLAGDYQVNVNARDNASGVIAAIRANLLALPQFRDISVRVTHRIVGATSGGIPIEARAQGGPVGAGRLYEVAEQGRAELLQMGSHTYLIPGQDGQVVASSMVGASAVGGGGATGPGAIELRVVGGSGLAGQFVQRMVRNGDIQLSVDGRRVRAA